MLIDNRIWQARAAVFTINMILINLKSSSSLCGKTFLYNYNKTNALDMPLMLLATIIMYSIHSCLMFEIYLCVTTAFALCVHTRFQKMFTHCSSDIFLDYTFFHFHYLLYYINLVNTFNVY